MQNNSQQHIDKGRVKSSLEKYVPLTLFVMFACERELETKQNCNILTPTLMAVSVVSFSFSRAAQLEAQGLSFLLSAGFLYHILSATSLEPNSPSSQSYIIVQCPLNRPLNPWNAMFDRHQTEITVMQFTGHSLPVYHSVATQWDLHLVPYYQPSSPARFLSITGHWDVSLPLSLEWHV